jgi:hypothetical protein
MVISDDEKYPSGQEMMMRRCRHAPISNLNSSLEDGDGGEQSDYSQDGNGVID